MPEGGRYSGLLTRCVGVDGGEPIMEDPPYVNGECPSWTTHPVWGETEPTRPPTLTTCPPTLPPLLGVPERHFKYDEILSTVQMLRDIQSVGLRIAHIGDAGKHGGWIGGGWLRDDLAGLGR